MREKGSRNQLKVKEGRCRCDSSRARILQLVPKKAHRRDFRGARAHTLVKTGGLGGVAAKASTFFPNLFSAFSDFRVDPRNKTLLRNQPTRNSLTTTRVATLFSYQTAHLHEPGHSDSANLDQVNLIKNHSAAMGLGQRSAACA